MSKISSYIVSQEEAGNLVFDEDKGEYYCVEDKDRARNPLSCVGSSRPPFRADEDRRQFPVGTETSEGEVSGSTKVKSLPADE